MEHALVDRVLLLERATPHFDHYVSHCDMHIANRLEKLGYLREGATAGCFYVTDTFRQVFVYDVSTRPAR